MIRFLGNPGSMKVHAPDCQFIANAFEIEEFEELYHAQHCGYEEAMCCLGNMPVNIAEASAKIRKRVLEQMQRCVICGRIGRIEMAHVVPRHAGGKRRVPLCPNHHQAFDFGELSDHELRELIKHCKAALNMSGGDVRRCHGLGRGMPA